MTNKKVVVPEHPCQHQHTCIRICDYDACNSSNLIVVNFKMFVGAKIKPQT